MAQAALLLEVFEKGYHFAAEIDFGSVFKEAITSATDQKASLEDAFFRICWEVSSHVQQYSPFEFTAAWLNGLEDSESFDAWKVFDEGRERAFTEAFSILNIAKEGKENDDDTH
jgi:hypothetical protein